MYVNHSVDRETYDIQNLTTSENLCQFFYIAFSLLVCYYKIKSIDKS